VTRVLSGGADVTIVASGHARALHEAAAMTRRGGEIVVVAYFDGPVSADLNGLIRRGISVRGSTLSTSREFEEVIGWLARGEVDPLPIVTHYFPLDQAGEAISFMKDRPGERGKIVLQPFHGPGEVEARH
jgi:threonine dehydrogenase-like Zn-dependent dehydrogenase